MNKLFWRMMMLESIFIFLAGCSAVLVPTPIATASSIESAQLQPTMTPAVLPSLAMPPGVQKIAIGTAFNNQDDCEIVAPLPAPIKFPPGTEKFAFQVVIDPEQAQGLRISVDGDGMEAGVVGVNCNKYAIIMGAATQYQWGATLSAAGGEALLPGAYVLTVTAGGQTVEMPFEIEK